MARQRCNAFAEFAEEAASDRPVLEDYDEEFLAEYNAEVAESRARALWREAQFKMREAKGGKSAAVLKSARSLLEKSLGGAVVVVFVEMRWSVG